MLDAIALMAAAFFALLRSSPALCAGHFTRAMTARLPEELPRTIKQHAARFALVRLLDV